MMRTPVHHSWNLFAHGDVSNEIHSQNFSFGVLRSMGFSAKNDGLPNGQAVNDSNRTSAIS